MAKFTCCISNSNPAAELGMEISLNGQIIWRQEHIGQHTDVECSVPDDVEAAQKLSFTMFGKNSTHTVVNEQGEIVSDAVLTLSDFCFDELEIDQQSVTENSIYQHNFNGSQPWVEETFYGSMGCNGTVVFKFTSPIYLWLLAHT